MNRENFTEKISEYAVYLQGEERSQNTVAKYARDLRAFLAFWGGGEISKAVVLEWKEKLIREYAPASVNSMLAAVNGFLDWMDKSECKVKPLKIQREIFARPEKELTRAEYDRLVRAAQSKRNERLALLLQTICATGIRVSELEFITVEAVKAGRALVDCKGKSRTVLLLKELCRSLICFCREQKITGGVVFRTASGKPLDRSNIWRDMKNLCESAGVERGKVFPPQSPAPVCAHLLLHREGPFKVGGLAGTFQREYHQNLHDGKRQKASTAVGTHGACFGKKIMTT